MVKILRKYIDTIGEIRINLANGMYGKMIKHFNGSIDLSDKCLFSQEIVDANIYKNKTLFEKYNYRFDNHRNFPTDLENQIKGLKCAVAIDNNLNMY